MAGLGAGVRLSLAEAARNLESSPQVATAAEPAPTPLVATGPIPTQPTAAQAADAASDSGAPEPETTPDAAAAASAPTVAAEPAADPQESPVAASDTKGTTESLAPTTNSTREMGTLVAVAVADPSAATGTSDFPGLLLERVVFESGMANPVTLPDGSTEDVWTVRAFLPHRLGGDTELRYGFNDPAS